MERNAARPELYSSRLRRLLHPARPRRSRRSPRRNPRQRGRNGAYRHSATERCWQKSNVTPSPCAEASFPAPDAISKQFSQSRLRLEVEAARCRRGETGADVRPRDGLGPSYRRAVECTSTAAGRKASADLSSKLPWAWQRSCRPTCAVLAARQKHRVARCCCRRQGWCGYEFALSHPKTPLAGRSDGLRHHRLVHAIVRCVVCASPMCPRPRLDLCSQSCQFSQFTRPTSVLVWSSAEHKYCGCRVSVRVVEGWRVPASGLALPLRLGLGSSLVGTSA